MLAPAQVREYYGNLTSISDLRLADIIDYAKRAVELDGVADSHTDFDRLHMLRIGVDLPGSATSKLNGVSSRSIDGVSVSYGSGSSSNDGSPMSRYKEALIQIIGLCHRIA